MENTKYLERLFCVEKLRNEFESKFEEIMFKGKKVELKYDKESPTNFALFVNNKQFAILDDFEVNKGDDTPENISLCVFYNCLMHNILANNSELVQLNKLDYMNDSKKHFNYSLESLKEQQKENELFNDVKGIESNKNDIEYISEITKQLNHYSYSLGRQRLDYDRGKILPYQNENTSTKNEEL